MFTKQYAPELSTIMGPITGFFYSKKNIKVHTYPLHDILFTVTLIT